MTRTLVFVSHTGEVSGAELVMLELMRLAKVRGHSVVLACAEGPLRKRAADIAEIIELPVLGLRGESGFDRISAITTVVKNWRKAGRVIASRTRGSSATVIVNSLFALPAIRLGGVDGGATWLVHDTLSSAKQRIVVRIAKPAIVKAVAVSGPTAVPVRQLGVHTTISRLGVPVPADVVDINSPATGVIGIMGSITPWKGHQVLLDAVAEIPEITLEVAGTAFPGDETYVEELQRRSALPDLAGRVRFLGHVDALSTVQRWDLAISASTSPEAGPLVLLEAMSAGVPVIGTNHGGTSEVLADGAGSLVAVGDASQLASEISRLLADHACRTELAGKGRRRVVERYDIKKNLPAMLQELVND